MTMPGHYEHPKFRARHGRSIGGVETRFVQGVELRLDESGEKPKIIGHGAVFNAETKIYGMREVVRKGAFRKTIQEGDIRGLFNHDVNWVLGRNRSKTMELREDERGLLYEITPPDTDLVRDLVLEPLRRGDVSGSSFSFSVVKQSWTRDDDGFPELRELLEVKLYDVGPVTFPAYEETDAGVRSLLPDCETVDEIQFLAALRGKGLTAKEVRGICRRILEITDAEPAQRHSADDLEARLFQLQLDSLE